MDSGITLSTITLPVAGTLLVYVLLKRIIARLRPARLPYPPGPKPKPIIGNMFDFPSSDLAMHYYDWEKKYNSKILHASALGSHVMVLNSFEDAEELFERRASNYSDRIQLPMIPLLGLHANMALMPHGTLWRKHRRIAQQNFRLDMMTAHEPVQARRVHLMLKALLEDPDNAFVHHRIMSMSIPLEYMYGYDVTSLSDPFIVESERVNEITDKWVNPDATLINFFPILGKIPPWVPGAAAQKAAAQTREIFRKLESEPMELVEKAVDEGVAVPSVLSEFVETKRGTPEYEEEREIVSQLALTIYSGASDTIISTLGALFYILATRPDIIKKGQEEIDRVIGNDRLPTFSDRSSLPYTNALYRELLRYYPPTPTAVPHYTREDDTYKGYFIPKGTIVFPNIWAMTRDETLYPDPFEFKPERFLDKNGNLTGDARVLTYGFGRRICIGKHSASSTLWITIASLLACFDFGKAKDVHGKEIDIPEEFIYRSIARRKTPFKCSITPRSEAVRRLVEETVAAERIQMPGH